MKNSARNFVDLRLTLAGLGMALSLLPGAAPAQEAPPSPPQRQGSMIIVSPEDEIPVPLPPPPNCNLPLPSADARIIRLGAREGGRISNIAIGGQDDDAFVSTVHVERGKGPIYVVATTIGPQIWHFTGATGRLQAVVLSGWTTRDGNTEVSGAAGVPKHKVHFVDKQCFGDFTENMSGKAFTLREPSNPVFARLGRPADSSYADYQFEGIAIPSMRPVELTATAPPEFTLPLTRHTANLWEDILTHYNGGIANLDPADVVAVRPVERFKTLPLEAGKWQLILNGSMEIAQVNGSTRYRIVKAAHLPPGLGGGYSEEFLLADGVPVPTGDPVHSKVIRESTGQCLLGCR